MAKPTPLSVRHDDARRRAHHRRQLLARRQASHIARHARPAWNSIMWKAAIRAPIRSTPNSSEIRKPTTKSARFCAFGMTKRPGRSAANDPGLAGLLAADADAIVYVAKSWDYHVHVALELYAQGKPRGAPSGTASRHAVQAAGREAMVDCEHFFDGYKANPKYALLCAPSAAIEAGARWAVLCDTNGGTLPDEIEAHRRRSRPGHPGRKSRHSRP